MAMRTIESGAAILRLSCGHTIICRLTPIYDLLWAVPATDEGCPECERNAAVAAAPAASDPSPSESEAPRRLA